MIDTHTHIYMPEFDADRDEVVQRAVAAGVSMLILPNVDEESLTPLQETLARYPHRCRAAMGLHPTSVTTDYLQQLETIRRRFDTYKYCAVGEIGIDLYWDKTYCKEQCEAFAIQIGWAQQMELPIIIHCREAFDETLQTLGRYPHSSIRGVFHSFTGTPEQVLRVRRDVGDFYFGINGIVTFKNAHLEELVKTVGLDRILLETDAPYLAPVPHRGRRNEPAYVPYMAARIADILGVDVETVDAVTTANAHTLFGV